MFLFPRSFIINIALPVSLFFTGFALSQESEILQAKAYFKKSYPDSALYILQKVDTIKLDKSEKGHFYYLIGNSYFLIDKHDIAFKQLIKAEKIFVQINDEKMVAEINFKIGQLLEHQKKGVVSSKPYFDKFINYALSKNDSKKLDSAYTRMGVTFLQNDKGKLAIQYFDKAILEARKSFDSLRIASLQFNKAVTYKTVLNKLDSALYIYENTIPVFLKNDKNEYVSYAYHNIAEVYKTLENCQKAIEYYTKADSVVIKKNIAKTKVIFYKNKSECYLSIGDYKNAAFNLNKLNKLKDSINDVKQNIGISKIKEQYDNEKLRADNLEIEAKRIKNRNLLLGSLSLILVGSIFVFLVYKNIKRKQQIAEQEKEIQIQKTEKLLKEQELTAIDAMISGQEKERQRLANELHDNLGSTLATVKLHFQHLQHNKDNPKLEHVEELYTKTNALLDEAYQKVRTIAHEKNSGVMANQGLLPAIKKLAKKVSNGDGLRIEVQDYGLQERLDNTLEISIFRMIQELITNTIKHAAASEIQISLTNHDSLLNIIIEDNGKGFDAKILPKKEGMGLRNIEKRVEHLQGTFEIDSTIGKGTNIIINIPI
ncbi:ATP-binding protein [Aquimarina megaterium]|uniref:ATP-binding protein n=1 Tax=Aquimarina megaterium TaxID=1443666 RepID=UPI000944C1AD|nr:sensor histidine kinase [Aquimarina megaterium]